tara:strand:+ start:787 stop:2070 length:1284 start_codon:yes stop_codon:yes gene_type:complete
MSLIDWSTPPVYEVYFPGQHPPGPNQLTDTFGEARVEFDKGGWSAEIEDVHGCKVQVFCMPQPTRDPSPQVNLAWGLSDEERTEFGAARAFWVVRTLPGDGPVLCTRKRAMRVLGDIMPLGSVGAIDLSSLRVWSKAAIGDELLTDADLDVESLYCIHAVLSEQGKAEWIHTHGLGALGGFDVDLLAPSDEAKNAAPTLIRALAYAIIEESVVVDEPIFELARPGGVVRMVPAVEFDAAAEARFVQLRDVRDKEHTDNRAVLCEPGSKKRSLFRRGPAKPEPSRFVRQFGGGGIAVNFSTFASERMAHRARQTLPFLNTISEEFASLGLQIAAKLGCPTNSGQGNEHMWFEIHSIGDRSLDATLLNQPFDIAGMKQGDRGRHPVEWLSDWMIQTPVGSITPSHFMPIHTIREHRPKIEQMMREYREK